MAGRVRGKDVGAVTRTFTRVRMRDASNILKIIQRIRGRDSGGTLRTLFEYFTASLDTSVANGFDSGAAISGTVVTDTVTATPTGGTAPYTYSWVYVSGDPEVTAAAPTSAGTTFTANPVYDGSPFTTVFRCDVTDNAGNVVSAGEVTAHLVWISTL